MHRGRLGIEQRASTLALNLWRISLVSTAVAMTAAVGHALELPAKMRYEPWLWVKLHRTLYWNFGRIAGPAEAAAVLSTGLLAWMRRFQPEAFQSTAVAAACLASTHAIFWSLVQPVNVEVLRWRLDAIPDDWTTRRDRWEYGHALRAGLVAVAFAALTLPQVCSPGRARLDSRRVENRLAAE
jgi:hypothetical protein